MAIDAVAERRAGGAQHRKRAVRLSGRDRIATGVMAGVPVLVVGGIVWFPTIASIVLFGLMVAAVNFFG